MSMNGFNQKVVNAGFLGALCVVLIHIDVKAVEGSFSWWVYQMMANGFCRWAVPFFFATAGYFLAAHINEAGWWQTAVRKRVRTLMIPFVLWNVIFSIYGIALTLVANILAGRNLSANLRTGWDILMYCGLHPLKGGNMGVLWFIETLFLFVLVSPLLVVLIRRFKWAVPIGLLGLCYVGLPGLPHNFNVGWMLYFAGGISARVRPVNLGRYWGGGIVLGMIWIGIHKNFMLTHGIVDRWDSTPLPAVILVLIGVWALVPSSLRLPRILASATFPIYLLHCFVLKGIGCAFPPIVSALNQLLTWVVVIVVCVGVAWCLRKLFPVASRWLFGGR